MFRTWARILTSIFAYLIWPKTVESWYLITQYLENKNCKSECYRKWFMLPISFFLLFLFFQIEHIQFQIYFPLWKHWEDNLFLVKYYTIHVVCYVTQCALCTRIPTILGPYVVQQIISKPFFNIFKLMARMMKAKLQNSQRFPIVCN